MRLRLRRQWQLFASLHFQCQCILLFSILSALWLRLVLEHKCCIYSALHAQHVAFLAHLERISPFPGPAQACLHWYALPWWRVFISIFFLLLLDNKTSSNPALFSYRQDQPTVIYVGNLILTHNTLRDDSIKVSYWTVLVQYTCSVKGNDVQFNKANFNWFLLF